ncbi:MAG TPA: FAD:protein FMN transferase [Burkholderiaceae bacterium]|nr:FAD:protein FMN transferase [Burkholderiaceae bacterium]
MSASRTPSHAVRRARPLLGTLVEVGLCAEPARDDRALHAACDIAFDAIADVQRCLSRFDAGSDIARFNALAAGGWLDTRADTQIVLSAARQLFVDSDGVFDVSLGSAPWGWMLRGHRLYKLHADARLDLGGIGKGHAVDRAVHALREAGLAGGWVNAGGDLRGFGGATVELKLRDEQRGGVVDFGRLHDGAFATSCFGAQTRSQLCASRGPLSTRSHVSVAAPSCLLADALTKVVAATGDPTHPLLARAGAQAWLH